MAQPKHPFEHLSVILSILLTACSAAVEADPPEAAADAAVTPGSDSRPMIAYEIAISDDHGLPPRAQRTIIRYADMGTDPVSSWTDVCQPSCGRGLEAVVVGNWDDTAPCVTLCLPVGATVCGSLLDAVYKYMPGAGLLARCEQ